MNWTTIDSPNDITLINERSAERPVMILKHSTTCPISSMAKRRLERDWDIDAKQLEPYYLDLLRHRPISNLIAEEYGVRHESPQVLVIENGKCVYHTSHLDISVDGLKGVA